MQRFIKGLGVAAVIGMSVVGTAFAQSVAPINVNTADAELLAELPGVGPSRAAAIVEERNANGEFENAEDLTRVSGIGQATVSGMEDQIVFSD
ncbi:MULTISPECIES: helix-hairpin-helix domain-containing protein [unclassified Halomonas]|uniref:ComEA family DNA-binding protein n=1 Tax=unclassified Halomonas TaxID=2609666 RepID=UPI0020A0523A|nr:MULTISPECIES: helix-hairpin-helix domain-containing protein [unclassified Halomonas]MCP1316138.1 helix-hairpin-helix domain-containing protein [Halomonas sp. 707D7]MCP1326672.1 helix-hairpin-helix domain-containing protein [Halomonas sp. 707D4]